MSTQTNTTRSPGVRLDSPRKTEDREVEREAYLATSARLRALQMDDPNDARDYLRERRYFG